MKPCKRVRPWHGSFTSVKVLCFANLWLEKSWKIQSQSWPEISCRTFLYKIKWVWYILSIWSYFLWSGLVSSHPGEVPFPLSSWASSSWWVGAEPLGLISLMRWNLNICYKILQTPDVQFMWLDATLGRVLILEKKTEIGENSHKSIFRAVPRCSLAKAKSHSLKCNNQQSKPISECKAASTLWFDSGKSWKFRWWTYWPPMPMRVLIIWPLPNEGPGWLDWCGKIHTHNHFHI